MPYLGLIVWLVLIWIIDCAVNPFFIWVTVALGALFVIGLIWSWWHDNYSKAFKRQTEQFHKSRRDDILRSHADEIAAWEKKYGRKHPLRQD